MNAFERHGIRNLSPSAINLWRANPALYVGKYLLKWRDDAWLNAWWGDAVEAGLASWLYKRDNALALDAARRQFGKVDGTSGFGNIAWAGLARLYSGIEQEGALGRRTCGCRRQALCHGCRCTDSCL